MAAALELRSHGDETSSNEKQTRDSPRVQEGARIGIIRQVEKWWQRRASNIESSRS